MSQTVLITGASGGLGKAFADEFASHGFNLVLVARPENKLKDIRSENTEKYKIKAEAFAVRIAPKTLVSRVIKKWQGGLIEKGNK